MRATTRLLQRPADISHLVIGGGVVGLSIAARLSAKHPTMLLERHSELGTETSSRNSEVIHAGINHPEDSLRTKLCIIGKQRIYEYAEKFGVEVQKCGKWVVAQDDQQHEYLQKMYNRARDHTHVPLNWVDLTKAKQLEPAVRANAAILSSPTTGIVSAHSLMAFYESQMEKNGADLALGSSVTGVEKDGNGYIVYCDTADGETIDIKAEVVINAAGHGAVKVQNSLLPPDRHLTAYFGKGNYFAYAASRPKVSRLVYPCPASYASLGTHLTLDLGGRLKFGPDFEWVNNENDVQPNGRNLEPAIHEIKQYLPDIDISALTPDYSGVRPKISKGGFQDFVIRQEEGFPGFVNLLNIESPGLTASSAIAEYVESIL